MAVYTIFEIYLWLLVLISLGCGISMTTFLMRNKHHKGNSETNEKYLRLIQRGFWIFLGVMAVIGVLLGMLTFG